MSQKYNSMNINFNNEISTAEKINRSPQRSRLLSAVPNSTGIKECSAIDLARKVLNKFGSFRNMLHTDSREWKEFKGLGPAKIAQLKAALEIGRRFREDEVSVNKTKISFAEDGMMI